MTTWTDDEMTDQTGRVAFVTGATSGIGLRTAEVLARSGARVLMASRDSERGARALSRVAAAASDAPPELVSLDLLSLDSVASAAAVVRERTGDRLDLLVNNAGIMAPPLAFSADGIESQWATNAIAPAALTWQLLPAMRNVDGSRITSVTSIALYGGRFDPEKVPAELEGVGYNRLLNYCHTKLTNLVFARQLERRLRTTGAKTMSVAAHPGVAESRIAANYLANGPEWAQEAMVRAYNLPAQPTAHAAWPVLFAATFPRMRGGYLIGPRGAYGTRGRPTAWRGSAISRDPSFAADVWHQLERATDLSGV